MVLYPIRVDATASDRSTRVIESFLIDPTCLPIPPSPGCTSSSTLTNPTSAHDSGNNTTTIKTTFIDRCIHENAQLMATNILTDLEVQVISSAKAGKASRLNLVSCPGLLQQVKSQIHTQLKQMFVHHHKSRNDSFGSPESTKDLVKVHIRIRENGISILDEFLIDPNITNPLILATSLCRDLNIPPENANSIAFSIAEQMLGLKVDPNVDGMLIHKEDGSNNQQQANQHLNHMNNWMDKGIEANRSIPSAWKNHEKEEGVALAHYVTSCRLR